MPAYLLTSLLRRPQRDRMRKKCRAHVSVHFLKFPRHRWGLRGLQTREGLAKKKILRTENAAHVNVRQVRNARPHPDLCVGLRHIRGSQKGKKITERMWVRTSEWAPGIIQLTIGEHSAPRGDHVTFLRDQMVLHGIRVPWWNKQFNCA